MLMGLMSTILITNSSFLDRYTKDKIESYGEFIQFLSEESSLTKKTIAWHVGNQTQSIFYFKNSSQYTILEIRETGSHLFDHKRNSQRVDAK